MSTSRQSADARAPFTRDEIVHEVRRAALGMASHIAAFGPGKRQLELAAAYLGIELEDYDLHSGDDPNLDRIPVEDHFLYTVVMDAYDHAYQVGSAGSDSFSVDERAYEVAGLLAGFPQTDFNGEPTPFDRLNPQKLRQVLDTFMARWELDNEHDLTVPQLALLANMGEAAVRTSLSAEGIRTVAGLRKGEKNQVPHDEAIKWLAGRRGFVPTKPQVPNVERLPEMMRNVFSSGSVSFEAGLSLALSVWRKDAATVEREAGIEFGAVAKLLSPSELVEIDLAGLERLAKTLQAPVPAFAGRAVTALLARRYTAG